MKNESIGLQKLVSRKVKGRVSIGC